MQQNNLMIKGREYMESTDMTEFVELIVRIKGTVLSTDKTVILKDSSGNLSEDFKNKLWSDYNIDVDNL